jgi:hypothetical protein
MTHCRTNIIGFKNTVFWVVTPCSSERVRRFGRKYRLYIQGQSESGQPPAFAGFLLGSFFELEDVDNAPPKSWSVLKLRGISTVKTVHSIVTAVRNSNPTVYGFHMDVDR